MPDFKTATLHDALNEMGGGVNLGDSPLYLPLNVMAGAINTSVRGKNVTHRPPYQNRPVTYVNVTGQISPTQTAVQTGVFQGCTEEVVLDDSGNAYVIALISGRVFSFAVGINGGNSGSTANSVVCTELLIYSGTGMTPQPVTGGVGTGATIYNATITGATISMSGTYTGTITGATITSAVLSGGKITGGTVVGGTITSSANVTTTITTATISVGAVTLGTITGLELSGATATGPAAVIQPQAWLWQSECWVNIQDGLSNPIIVNLNTQVAVRSSYGAKVQYSTTLTSSPTTGGPGSTFDAGFSSVSNLSVGKYVYVFNQGTFIVLGISGTTVTLQTVSSVGYLTSGQTIYWNGVGTGPQPGRMGAYGIGRNWYALVSPCQFIAGDIVNGASGTPAYNFRDAVLQTTENTYITGGGTFCIPGTHGAITAIKFLAQENVVDGQAALMVSSRKSMYMCQAPVDRLTWQSVTNPILTTALISNGAKGQWSTVASNSDIVFRANDGLRSMLLDQVNFQAWGKPPYSFEVNPILAQDNFALLNFESAIVFNNRLLHTVNPQQSSQGVYHTGIIPLNYDPISSLRGKAPAVFDSGIWIGSNQTTCQFQAFQLTVGEVGGVERAFALVLNTNASPNQIEFWEILQDDAQDYDNDGTNNIPIPWQFDSASLRFGIDKKDHVYMQLSNGEIWVDELVGTVNFQVQYRSDQFPGWTNWHSWQSQQTVDSSISQPAFLPRMGLGEPSAVDFDPSTNRPKRDGFTFQTRHKITGHCVFLGEFYEAVTKPIPKFAAQVTAPLP